jgi:hypothetical protein
VSTSLGRTAGLLTWRQVTRRARAVSALERVVQRLVMRSDVALGYALIVISVFIYMQVIGGATAETIVAQASTNLINLRAHPFEALALSAFVISEPAELLLLPVLVVTYAFAQYYFGRAAVLVSILIGHLLATLVVAVTVLTSIFHGVLQPDVSQATDVGFSYGLACVNGLLAVAVPRGHRRRLYVAALVGVWSLPILLGPPWLRLTNPTFTDLGHSLALLTGFCLSSLPGCRSGPPQYPAGD